jgi:peroxiredoxin
MRHLKWTTAVGIISFTLTLLGGCARSNTTAPEKNSGGPGPNPNPALELHLAHSAKGQAFNFGPVRFGKLISGTGDVRMTVSTTHDEARNFFLQGLGQLHGFWAYEAERSFRQAEFLDPNFAMSYWGMAMANTIFQAGSQTRAKEFIQKAYDRISTASPFEAAWISATWNLYRLGVPISKESRERFVDDLAVIEKNYPLETEAKAMLALFIWENAVFNGSNLNVARVDRLLDDVLKVQPMHPGAHHYKIHLWSSLNQPAVALASANLAGRSGNRIAHLSHMPGHIYWALDRFFDSAHAQEASARLDHRSMAEFGEWPYEIHNYLHNNTWLISSLSRIGAVSRATDIAVNLQQIPQHPTLNDGDFISESARALVALFDENEMWERVIDPDFEPFLAGADGVSKNRIRLLANYYLHHEVNARAAIADLKREIVIAGYSEPSPKKTQRLSLVNAEIEVYEALLSNDFNRALAAGNRLSIQVAGAPANKDYAQDDFHLDRIFQKVHESKLRVDAARALVKSQHGGVASLIRLAVALQDNGQTKEACETFTNELQPRSEQADLDVPLAREIKDVATACGAPADWRVPRKIPSDVDSNERLKLADLGPVLWEPRKAPNVSVVTLGKPTLLVFYLGEECAACSKQLSALSGEIKNFADLGISITAISKDAEPPAGKRTFPVLGDESRELFKAFGVFNDFEKDPLPLHGIFLIDAQGYIRWSEISADPFMNFKFLKEESKRCLSTFRPKR